MSVNEVKIRKATTPFQIKGTGPPGSRTFAIGDEDHTLGNAVRHVLSQNSNVEFAGYAVPHPQEPVVHVRVQTVDKQNHTAVDALKEACDTLHQQCAHVLDQLEVAMPEVKDDRLAMEQYAQEQSYYDEDEDAGEEG